MQRKTKTVVTLYFVYEIIRIVKVKAYKRAKRRQCGWYSVPGAFLCERNGIPEHQGAPMMRFRVKPGMRRVKPRHDEEGRRSSSVGLAFQTILLYYFYFLK